MFICAMSEVERVKVEGQVDVFQTIKGMRIQRPHMVDTPVRIYVCECWCMYVHFYWVFTCMYMCFSTFMFYMI